MEIPRATLPKRTHYLVRKPTSDPIRGTKSAVRNEIAAIGAVNEAHLIALPSDVARGAADSVSAAAGAQQSGTE